MTVLGVDLSIEALRVQARDAATGVVTHEGCTTLAAGAGPDDWWEAWSALVGDAASVIGREGRSPIAAVAVTGDGEGLLALDADGAPVHPVLPGSDDGANADAGWLRSQLAAGGAGWAQAVGSVPRAAQTIAKLSWLHRSRPDAWAALHRVCVPHDWLTWRLSGTSATDRGSASGTGYWSPASGAYRWDLLAIVDRDRDWDGVLPSVCDPVEPAGRWHPDGTATAAVVGPGTGRRMAAALAFDLLAGDIAVDLELDEALAICDGPVADPSGTVTCLADATGRLLLTTPLTGAGLSEVSAAIDALRHHLHDVGPGRVVLHGDGDPRLSARLHDARGVEVSHVAVEHPGVTGACIQAAAVLGRRDPSDVRSAWSATLDRPA